MLTTFRLYLLDEKLYEDDKNDKRQRICKADLSKLKNWSEFLYKASVAADLEVVARRVFDAEGFEVTNLSQLRPKEEEVPKKLILSTEVMVPEERVLACLIRGFEWSKEGAEKKEEEAKKEEEQKGGGGGGGEEEEETEEEDKMKQVKDIFPEVKAEIIRRLLEGEKGNVERVVQRIIEDCNRLFTSSSSPPKEKEKVIEEVKKEDKEKKQEEQEKKEEKDEGKEVKEEKGKEKAKVGESEERQLKGQPVKRLTELCLEAARMGWSNIANHILRLEPQLQDVVVDYMWRNGVFEDVQKTEEEEEQLHHNKQEMIELNDFFEDLLQTGEAGEDSGNDIFCFGGMRGEEEGASGFMMMDEELAKTLQNIEEEAMRTLRRMEEEDARLALRLVAEERQESKRKEDERLAFALAREEVVSTSVKKNVEKVTKDKDEDMMQLIKRLEQEEEQERKRREKEDEDMAKRLLAEEEKLIKAKLEDEERARKASERKLRELEDERLARQLEERERMHSSSNNSCDKDFAKALQLQQEEEANQLKEEIERRRKREEELSQQYIEKMLLKQQTEESHYNPPSTITPPITAITTTNTFTNTMTTTNEDSTIATYNEVEESDWKSCSFFDWDTRTMEQFLRSRGGAVKVRKILKPELVERFEKKWFELIKKYGSGTKEAKPRLAFHGTRSNLIPSIVTKGLLVPGGSSGVGHTTDSGWYGKGIYLSPNPDVSLGYTHGGRMLVCSVLMGKVYKCTTRCDGAGCRPGYDSHESPCGQEYVLFSAAQVLPCYLIEFSGTATNVTVSPSTPFTFHPYQPKNDHKCVLQ